MSWPYRVAKLGSQAIFIAAVSALPGCTAPPSRTVSATSPVLGLGEAKSTAVEVCNPPGERAYLDRLQCPDGSVPTYRRVGSFGGRNALPTNLSKEQEYTLLQRVITGAPLQPGEPDYHVIDGYELVCGSDSRMVYMDMYHCRQAPPNQAPAGFQFREPA